MRSRPPMPATRANWPGAICTPARRWLHLVDLDGARSGSLDNLAVIQAIAADGMQVQAGGGVRERGRSAPPVRRRACSAWCSAAWRSASRRRVARWLETYGGERITLALDTRRIDDRWALPSAGWTELEARTLDELAPWYAERGAQHLLCTDIDRDGMLAGFNLDLYRHLAETRAATGGAGVRWRAFAGRHPRGARGGRARRDPGPGAARRSLHPRGGAGMLSRRIIPCLDVRDGQVVKGVRFRDHVVMGEIVDLALRYRDEGADELVFYDITASPEGRSVDRGWVERVARVIDIPFCVAGGIRSVDEARAVLHAGADKISVNSPALERPELIDELAAAFGVQCVVVGIDSLRDDDGEWRVRQYTGDPSQDPGAGAPDAGLDGRGAAARRRRDRAQLHGQRRRAQRLRSGAACARRVRLCHVPLIASGGAGAPEHFRDAFVEADVDGALAASVFHSGAIAIPELKRYLHGQGVAVRLSAGGAT